MKLLIYFLLVELVAFLGISPAPITESGIGAETEVLVETDASSNTSILALNRDTLTQPRLMSPVVKEAADSHVWTQTYESPDLDSDMITLDADGNLGLAGSAFVVGENLDVRVSKYDSEGAVVWTKSFTDSPHGSDDAFTVALDPEGNVLGIGYEEEDYW